MGKRITRKFHVCFSHKFQISTIKLLKRLFNYYVFISGSSKWNARSYQYWHQQLTNPYGSSTSLNLSKRFNFQKAVPPRAVCVSVLYKPHDFCDRWTARGRIRARRRLNLFTGLPINTGEKGTSTEAEDKCQECHTVERSVFTAVPAQIISQWWYFKQKRRFCAAFLKIF